ncbi:uncharacterized protein LOC6609921 isoform X1 [Drosophila sechellia]|uniref:uncharacterized protein LOC6609921 isoform X1 n=1 Tax=Drosophila sechellia TaxID=7238 RepID=UPI0013DE3DFE|nr:uncharacterized protein LOC6609921 isoform X1 [Drosophila sechellia]
MNLPHGLSKSLLPFTVLGVVLMSAAFSNVYILYFAALDCYVCTYLNAYSDTSCLKNASAVTVLNCTKKYCVTMRVEMRRNSSKVMSFQRDCQDKPMMLYGNKPDETFRTYFTSCQQDRCNGHDGRVRNSTNGSGGSGIHNAIIPGKSPGQVVFLSPWIAIVLIIVALCQFPQ